MVIAIAILYLVVASEAQQHRAGTTGPETPPLQGQGHWLYRAPLLHARGEVAVAEAGGKVYVLGGYANGFVDQPLNEEYDPATNTWRERAPMPRGLNHVGAVGLNGKVYCLGGFLEQNRDAVTDVSVYDPATDRWQKLAPLPSPLGSVAVAVIEGKIHAVGGRDKVSVGTHRVYDPATDRWSELAPVPEGRDHMGLASVGGKLSPSAEDSTPSSTTRICSTFTIQRAIHGDPQSQCLRPGAEWQSLCWMTKYSYSAENAWAAPSPKSKRTIRQLIHGLS
jgi:hypothetical protein